MIYTITFNPAVDVVLTGQHFQLGQLNRSSHEGYVAGGKGINMSVLLKRLGKDSVATGFLAGFTGQFIESELRKEGVEPDFIQIEGITRINCKLHADTETEINGNGPEISPENFDRFYQYFNERLEAGDLVFLAGNAAPGMAADAYQKIAALCWQRQAYLILDTNLALLTACLPHHPFIIKPNHHELGEIFGVEIKAIDEIIYYGRALQEKGARHVLVSRGGQGAVLITEEGLMYQSSVPTGQVLNSVGAGDSMLAGFMASYLDTKNFETALRRGAAAGSATAFSVGIGQADFIQQLENQISVSEIKGER
ncbi:1-phosphofructokinase [Vaginisenegalia massiliensis]|uniref:1-phosphofructokinase n=1 Tax=Vaginisenegalia massiliensis TaxID=2058294 RepID=UPI000F5219C9|nr:1-phosphofructokinase [Vaginisenegalia massiliensis]